MSGQLLAAWRDASYLTAPGRARRYHVITDGLAACNSVAEFRKGALPLIIDQPIPAREVEPGLRCRRPACAAQFRMAGFAEEPTCCGEAMLSYAGGLAYECAESYFTLHDDDVIDHIGATPPILMDRATAEHRRLHEHLLETRLILLDDDRLVLAREHFQRARVGARWGRKRPVVTAELP